MFITGISIQFDAFFLFSGYFFNVHCRISFIVEIKRMHWKLYPRPCVFIEKKTFVLFLNPKSEPKQYIFLSIK